MNVIRVEYYYLSILVQLSKDKTSFFGDVRVNAKGKKKTKNKKGKRIKLDQKRKR